MASLGLDYGSFKLVAAGEQVLEIKEVKCVPKKKPTQVIIKFEDVTGGKIENKYSLGNTTAIFALTMVISKACGYSEKSIDTDEIPGLIEGKFVKMEIVHKEVDKKDEDGNPTGEKLIFANVKKAIGPADGFDAMADVALDDEEDGLDLDEDDDDLDLDLDDDDDDLPI